MHPTQLRPKVYTFLLKQSSLAKTIANLNKAKQNNSNIVIQPKQTQFSVKNSNRNESQLKNSDAKQLEYSDYERIVEQNQLSVKYFQAIAEKNDEIQKDKFLGGFQITQRQMEAQTNRKRVDSTHLNLNIKTHSTKLGHYSNFRSHHRSESAGDQFIVGSDRGALSNLTIAQKILNQSIQRHKTVQKLVKYSKIKTESDITSNRDEQTQHFPSTIRKKSSKAMKSSQKPKAQLILDKIPSQKCKYLIGKIFNVKHNQSPRSVSAMKVQGSDTEYDQFDRNLMRKERLLRFRSNNLTHKTQWKV